MRGIAVTAYSPLAKGLVAADAIVLGISRTHAVSPSAVTLAWLCQRDIVATGLWEQRQFGGELVFARGDAERCRDDGHGRARSWPAHRRSEEGPGMGLALEERSMIYEPAADRYEWGSYRRVGRSGLLLPAISLGLWHNFGGMASLETARAMLRRAFDLGVTHFDLANNYGPPPCSAETLFGRILAEDFRPYRDELIVSSKAGYLMWPGRYGQWGLRKCLLASLDQSLQRLGLDWVDIFYSHRFGPDTPLEETMGALDQAVRTGKALSMPESPTLYTR